MNNLLSNYLIEVNNLDSVSAKKELLSKIKHLENKENCQSVIIKINDNVNKFCENNLEEFSGMITNLEKQGHILTFVIEGKVDSMLESLFTRFDCVVFDENQICTTLKDSVFLDLHLKEIIYHNCCGKNYLNNIINFQKINKVEYSKGNLIEVIFGEDLMALEA